MLGKTGKLLEKIIAGRITRHLESVGPDLSENQFGFRRRRSTIDALKKVREYATRTTEEGERTLAISLDIGNAFNSLPWEVVLRALRRYGVPVYLWSAAAAYLADRSVTYPTTVGWERRGVECGVPQGSVLEPLLWDLAYDDVLRSERPPGCTAVCYTDDTLLLASGRDWADTRRKAEECAAGILRDIRELGLTANAAKTEATWLGVGTRRGLPWWRKR